MSKGLFALIVIDLAIIVWIWREARKFDLKHEVDQAFDDELLAEAEAFNERQRQKFGPPILQNSRDYEATAFALDEPDQPHPPTNPKAA